MTIDLSLKTLAWKALRREFGTHGGAIDITKSWLYPYVIAMAEHSRGRVFARLDDDGYTAGKVVITDHDFEHAGAYITPARMRTLSKMICDKERDDICLSVAYIHALTGVGMRQAFETILLKRGYDDADLNYQLLKKCYQRHFRQVEKEIIEDYQHIITLKNIQ